MAPLGPFAGTLLIDFPEQIAGMHEHTAGVLAAQGIDVVPLPEFDRGEWLGVFEFEVEVVVEVVGFHATPGRTEEEAQQASLAYIVFIVAAAVIVLFTFLTVDRGAEPFVQFVDAVRPVLPVVSIALGFLAIALLVREIRKTASLGKGLTT